MKYRPHICEQAKCYKNCEYTLEYKGETLYFCGYHLALFIFALWVHEELNRHLQPNNTEEGEEKP